MVVRNKALYIMKALIFSTLSLLAQKQSILVTGTIVDSLGHPISSASITVNHFQEGTSSDSLGKYNITVKPDAILLFTAFGFADTTVSVDNHNEFNVIMQRRKKNTDPLNVLISTPKTLISSTPIYLQREAAYNSGVRPVNMNSGTMIPVTDHKEETKGSRFLFPKFVKGLVLLDNDTLMEDSSIVFNFDKVDGQLLMAQDPKKYLEVNKEKVSGFVLNGPESSYAFINVPILSKTSYFIPVAKGSRYSIYKSLKTRFVKSNFYSSGLVETGNNFDEYVDSETYYWVDEKREQAGLVLLKKKSIKQAFAMEKQKTDAYFSMHKMDYIDEDFIIKLIKYLNE